MTSDDSRQRASSLSRVLRAFVVKSALFERRCATRRHFAVQLGQAPLVLPATCACCGAPAARQVALRKGERSLLAGYCEECSAHLAERATLSLAVTAAELLLGFAFAFAVPIALPWQSSLACCALSLLGCALPLCLFALLPRPRAGHAAFGPAVVLASATTLVCAREAYAREVARGTNLELTPGTSSGSGSLLRLVLLLGISAVLAPLSYRLQHPSVRVLNFADSALEIAVDDHALGRVEPSSGESPFAGLEVRVPAGERTFTASSNGVSIDVARVSVRAGGQHLYVPADSPTCFWFETAGYGRDAREIEYEPLRGEPRFWAIPERVRGWFIPLPQPEVGVRASGGSTTVLRQGPCADAPYEH